MDKESGFGKRLTQARQRARLTQEQLGKGLGTDGADAGKSVVYGWEKRSHYPRVEQLTAICERLNCSADWLVLGIDPAWPFSADLRKALARLTPRDLVKMDNLMRAPLEMPPLPLPPEETPAPLVPPPATDNRRGSRLRSQEDRLADQKKPGRSSGKIA